MRHARIRELSQHLFDARSRHWSDIMNGYDQRALHVASVAGTEKRTSRNCGPRAVALVHAEARRSALHPGNQLKLGLA